MAIFARALARFRITASSHVVIRHQAIRRAEKSLAGSSVEGDFAEARMEGIVQPARAAHGDGHGPMNDRIGLIIFARQALQIETPICA
jgi:hypothetical protein